jgi:hypothetical protein
MKGGLVRVATAVGLVAAVIALAVSVGAATAPAGGVPEATLTAFMDKTTYGGNAAYTSTFTHSGKSQTHVRYHNPIPENGDEDAASFLYASCDGVLNATEFVCDPIKLKKNDTATVVIVWKTFGDDTSECEGSEPCFVNEGYWTSDSGTNAPQKPKKTTDVSFEIGLLESDDDDEAATYALEGCDPEDLDTATLKTNANLSEDNPLATIVCIPSFAQPDELQPGLVGTVLEAATDQVGAFGEGSEVCVAVTLCSTPFQFDTPGGTTRITFVFFIHEPTFEALADGPVTTIFHDGAALLSCDDPYDPDTDPCVVSIESEGGLGTTTVVATGTDNGGWDFG